MQQGDAIHAFQCFSVALVDPATLTEGIVDMTKLQDAEGGLDFVHFAVDAGGHDRHFVRKAEVLQVVDSSLEFFVLADNGAPFESIEHLGGVEA
ncbi:hypothetical protein D3C76_1628970 [compost metagenome]